MKEWVSVSDVCDVSTDTYMTAPSHELMQVRGENSIVRCNRPACTVPASKHPAFISPHFVPGSVDKVGDIEEDYRRLASDECLVLQSFPQSWKFPDSFSKAQKLQCVGNAVPPKLAESIAEKL